MTAHRLDIIDLSCARGDQPLFEKLHQEIKAGEVLYVVGSNGSGKTTLLRTLCGLSRPADGEIRWCGTSIHQLGDEYRQDIAYLGHKDGIQGDLTPSENLRETACLNNASRAPNDRESRALERLGLAAYASFPAKILSQGQKRRLALARLLVTSKPLWILDEPFTALDAASSALISEIISEHVSRGGIAVLSSHQAFDIAGATIKRLDLDQVTAGKRKPTARAIARAASSPHHSA